MKIRELIAALRGSRRQPERGASQAPQQRDAVRVRGRESSGLTAEEAQGRRQLLLIAAAVWAPLIVNTLATGLSALSVGLSVAAVAVTIALVLGWPLGRYITSAVLALGGLAAIAGAFAHSWPEKWLYILTFVSWESAAGMLENSSAIDGYEERDEEW